MSRKNAVIDSLKIKNIMRSNLSIKGIGRNIEYQTGCQC